MIRLQSCLKGYCADQDKSLPPYETLARVKKRLAALPFQVLEETRRIDTGRLGIPVFMSMCGSAAASIMPTRKQMGKGATSEQAEASAVMELMERFAFFSFWEEQPGAVHATWSEAERLFPGRLLSLAEVAAACHDCLDEETARAIMDTRKWAFFPATDILEEKTVYVPLDLFKLLNEFNGSSAGNTDTESIFQGACELVERHVCSVADKEHPTLPGIDPNSLHDPVLAGLMAAFSKEGITVLLKDFSLGYPVPTVAVLAYDPATLGKTSELVFTAGTAASPAKAAIRALTEVAQLAGDFCTSACYEASGLPKYERLEDCAWLREGPLVALDNLPTVEDVDILVELKRLAEKLRAIPLPHKGGENAKDSGAVARDTSSAPCRTGYCLYSIATTNPATNVPSHYSFVPGFGFRERASTPSLGLFAGRMLAESEEPDTALGGLETLEQLFPGAAYIPFFRGMLALREGNTAQAVNYFEGAVPLQPDPESRALALFYQGYCHSLDGDWQSALLPLAKASGLLPDQKEYRNLHGVCLFKLDRYAQAAEEFLSIVTRLDKGSAMDWQNLGLCRKFLGEIDTAKHALVTALSIDPSLTAAREHLDSLVSS